MKTLRQTLLCLALSSAFSFLFAQQTYDIRFQYDGVDCEKKTVCYNVQLRSASGENWILAGQNYRFFYDASKAKYQVGSGTSQLPPDDYSPFTLTTNVPGTDASAFNGLLDFDETLGFLNYQIDLMDLTSGGITLTDEWISTSQVCFDLEDNTIDNVDECINIVWARPGLTDAYATAFVTASEWTARNTTPDASANIYDDLDENDGDGACISAECGVGNPTEVGNVACSDGIDNDNDGLTDCEDPNCEQADPCIPTEQNSFAVRLSLESFDCDNNQACYAVELRSEGRNAFLLGNQTYSLFYNSDVASFVQGSSVMDQNNFSPFTLLENTENTDASDLEGIAFDSDLGFLSYTINLTQFDANGMSIPTNTFVKTSTLCFNISESAIGDDSECFNVVWGRNGVTDAYSSTVVQVESATSASESLAATGASYDDLNSDDGDASCFTNQCAGGGENTEALCTDGMDNDNDGLVDCADPDCDAFGPCSTADIFIGDFVFEDLNGNGIQDAGEGGVNGMTISIFADTNADGQIDDPNNPLATTVSATGTNGDGQYGFNVPAGSYILRASALGRYVITTREAGGDFRTDNDFDRSSLSTSTIAVVDGNVRNDFDLGLFRLASLSGIAFNDANSDGIQQADDDGINNVIVNLYADNDGDGQPDGDRIATMTTATINGIEGSYLFTNLDPGSYIVEFEPGVGLTTTTQDAGDNDNVDSDIDPATGRTMTIALGSGEIVDNVYGGFISGTTIGDFVWNDADGDGMRDADESGLNGITIRLYNADGELVRSTVTSNDPVTGMAGYYLFSDIEPGEYYIELILGGPLVTSAPNAVSDETIDSDITDENGPNTSSTFTVEQGQRITDLDAGIYSGGSISGIVWFDEMKANNSIGIYDAGVDPPLEGVLVKLLDENGEVIEETLTNQNGQYSFSPLMVGTYQVMVVLPDGNTFVTSNLGNDEAVDSDVTNFSTGTTDPITLGVSENVTEVSAGLVPGSVPIELISFAGYWDQKRDVNELNWATASEINNELFEIERSLNPADGFHKVGEVAGNGTSNSVIDYDFTDSDISLSATYYYRLKQVDYNGDYSYSDVIAIDVNRIGKAYVNVIENPVSEELSLEIFSEDQAIASMVLYDVSGRIMQNVVDNARSIQSGINKISMDASALNRGQYILTVTMADQRFVKKLIKL